MVPCKDDYAVFLFAEKSAISATFVDNQTVTGGRWVADMADILYFSAFYQKKLA